MPSMSTRTSIRKMILLLKQPITHDSAHLYFETNQKATDKTKDYRKILNNQCHYQYHTLAVHFLIWCTHHHLQIGIVCTQLHQFPLVLSTPGQLQQAFRFYKDFVRFEHANKLRNYEALSYVCYLYQFLSGLAYTGKTLEVFRIHKDCMI